jgi:hypothetical protein
MPFSPPFFLCASEFPLPSRASAAPTVGSPNPNPNWPSRVPRCVCHVVLYLPGQTSSKMEPGRPRSANVGEPPPREITPATRRRRPSLAVRASRPIPSCGQDYIPRTSPPEPSDRKPMPRIRSSLRGGPDRQIPIRRLTSLDTGSRE